MIGKQICAAELQQIITNGIGNAIVVDVRTPDEFAKGAIAGAKNIPLDQIVSQVKFLQSFPQIYLYCLSGSRSDLASLQLTQAGCTSELFSLTSGLLAWRGSGYTLV